MNMYPNYVQGLSQGSMPSQGHQVTETMHLNKNSISRPYLAWLGLYLLDNNKYMAEVAIIYPQTQEL